MLVRLLSLAVVASLCLQTDAHAQAPGQAPAGYSQIATGTIPAMQAGSNFERLSGRNNPAVNYYGGGAAQAYAAAGRPIPMPPPRPVNIKPAGKPFSGVQQAAAISPYLGLDATRENENSLPNYFLYVKPSLDQQRVNQVQQAQYRKLQQQVRTAAAPGVVNNPGGGIPTTGHSAQFMNNGGYYPTMQR